MKVKTFYLMCKNKLGVGGVGGGGREKVGGGDWGRWRGWGLAHSPISTALNGDSKKITSFKYML